MIFTPKRLIIVCFTLCFTASFAQQPATLSAADIFQQIQKLKTLGSALYIAAHPDDENTHLLTWFSKGRLFRTGYLSLTRGDGGQNLIGDEQGISLGLIRTQELMAARRIDGAEQFFSRAFDFGFSKSADESFAKWDKNKILSDVVWVIRKFQPDIIITRFPEDKRAGHGHHAASAILAREAFRAAADPAFFPEQFKLGVKPWQAKRILWNAYRFGSVNYLTSDQLQVDVGDYNALIGKSYGELAAESESQHKSQGNGSSSSRGPQMEHFAHVDGARAIKKIDEGIDFTWKRIGAASIDGLIEGIIKNYSFARPERSVSGLTHLYKQLGLLPESYWTIQKRKEIQNLVLACTGLWLEAVSANQLAVKGDSVAVYVAVNSRSGAQVTLKNVRIQQYDTLINRPLKRNVNVEFSKKILLPDSIPVSQPYWLAQPMSEGSFNVANPSLIGYPEAPPTVQALFHLQIGGQDFYEQRPVVFKYTDPVKGELYQPLVVVPALTVSADPEMIVAKKSDTTSYNITIKATANRPVSDAKVIIRTNVGGNVQEQSDTAFAGAGGMVRQYGFMVDRSSIPQSGQKDMTAAVELKNANGSATYDLNLRSIKYDHIPDIHFFTRDAVKITGVDMVTAGSRVGYIEGAGDKVPEALARMGFQVTILKEKDIYAGNLLQFDAVITGIRAYNIHAWLFEKNEVLNDYIREGGNLIVQYNTSRQAVFKRTMIGPFPFSISPRRVTDESAPVKFLLPDHPVLNYPNKINAADFDHWIQERGIYFAENLDPAFVSPLVMNDPAEPDQTGSLVIADYGKGKFVYTGLVFFRELPAGIPGAYRLMANIIALNQSKNSK